MTTIKSISAHPSLVYIYGVYHQPVTKTSGQVSPSSTLIIIDVVNKLVLKLVGPETFSTAGHTLTFIDEDTLLISGRTKRALTLYTSKPLIPDKCDRRDKCEIDESFVSPIPWVFCEGKCRRCLHQFCIGMKSAPKGKFICNDCLQQRPGKRKRKGDK